MFWTERNSMDFKDVYFLAAGTLAMLMLPINILLNVVFYRTRLILNTSYFFSAQLALDL